MRFHSGFRTAALVAGALAGAAFALPAHAEQSPYIGEVMFFTRSNLTCPSGWELADGKMLSIDENPVLYGVIGTTYGGDGMTTFALPDLRGRIVRGVGEGLGLTPVKLGEKGGAESVTLTPANLGLGVNPGAKLAPAPTPPGAATASGATARTPSSSLPTRAPTQVVLACVATVGAYPFTN